MSTVQLPDGVRSFYAIKAAAVALNMDERLLLSWCRSGSVAGFQLTTPGGKWYVPSVEIKRIASLALTTPDWLAAMDSEDPTDPTGANAT